MLERWTCPFATVGCDPRCNRQFSSVIYDVIANILNGEHDRCSRTKALMTGVKNVLLIYKTNEADISTVGKSATVTMAISRFSLGGAKTASGCAGTKGWFQQAPVRQRKL